MVDNSAAAEDEALKRLYLPKEEYLASLPEQVSVVLLYGQSYLPPHDLGKAPVTWAISDPWYVV